MDQLNLLVGKTDFEPYLQVSVNLKDDRHLAPHILQAQNLDIKPALGNAFYTDMVKNYTDDNYQALLGGGEYVQNGNTLSFQGLKAAIVSFSYARYIYSRNAVDTPFGMVTKTSDYTQAVDAKTLTQVANFARNSGEQYLHEIIQYLNASSALFPLWTGTCGAKRSGPGSYKMTPASRF